MRNPPIHETIADINTTIKNLNEAAGMIKYIGKYSNDVQQARFDQFVTITNTTIRSLEKIKFGLEK